MYEHLLIFKDLGSQPPVTAVPESVLSCGLCGHQAHMWYIDIHAALQLLKILLLKDALGRELGAALFNLTLETVAG